MELLSLMLLLVWFAIPALFIYWIVRIVARTIAKEKKPNEPKTMSDRDFILVLLVVAAGSSGLLGIFMLSDSLFYNSSSGGKFATLVFTGTLLLMAGLYFKHFTGKFLMGLGLVVLLGALPSIFYNIGDRGAFLLVLLAFISLILVALRPGGRGKNGR